MGNLRRTPNLVFKIQGFLEEGTLKMKSEGQFEIIKMLLGY